MPYKIPTVNRDITVLSKDEFTKIAKKQLITIAQAAKILGLHRTRIGVFIRSGRLPARKFGISWQIKESDLKLIGDRKCGKASKFYGKKQLKS